MKNNRFDISFNKFLAGSLGVGFFGASIVSYSTKNAEKKEA